MAPVTRPGHKRHAQDTKSGYLAVSHGHCRSGRKPALTSTFASRRRAESNRCTGLCRPLPKPLGHAALPRQLTPTASRCSGPGSAVHSFGDSTDRAPAGGGCPPRRRVLVVVNLRVDVRHDIRPRRRNRGALAGSARSDGPHRRRRARARHQGDAPAPRPLPPRRLHRRGPSDRARRHRHQDRRPVRQDRARPVVRRDLHPLRAAVHLPAPHPRAGRRPPHRVARRCRQHPGPVLHRVGRHARRPVRG